MKQWKICRKCGCPIDNVNGVWVVFDPSTTADGLSYCPPNPDHTGYLGAHAPKKEAKDGGKRP